MRWAIRQLEGPASRPPGSSAVLVHCGTVGEDCGLIYGDESYPSSAHHGVTPPHLCRGPLRCDRGAGLGAAPPHSHGADRPLSGLCRGVLVPPSSRSAPPHGPPVGGARRASPAHGPDVPLPEPDLGASPLPRARAGPRRDRWPPHPSLGRRASGDWRGPGRARRGPTRGPPAACPPPIHTAPPGPGDANPAHASPPGRWGRRVGRAAGASRRPHPGCLGDAPRRGPAARPLGRDPRRRVGTAPDGHRRQPRSP
jgi:hypothetical protein